MTDRPWALTLAQMARRGVTGEITLVSDDKRYAVAFDRGAIVAARSPLSADSVVRVALTSRFITPALVNELQRRFAADPTADEIDLLGDTTRLAATQLDRLRTEVVTRQAARTFAPEQGEFVITDNITLPTRPCGVDIRAVVYYGVRMHVSDERLANELRALGGSYFVLEQDVTADLAKFGFGDAEWPLLAALREGVTIPELEARHRDIDPRTLLAAIYALFACGSIRITVPPTPSRTSTPTTAVPRTQTAAIARSPLQPRIQVPSPPVVPRTQPAPRGRSATNAPPHIAFARGTQDSVPPPAPTKTPPQLAAEAAERANRALAAHQPEAAVVELKRAVELVPNDVDYKALLGWALFCAADDKAAIAAESRKLLERAVYKSQRPEIAQFYLGRVERMLGRDKEALRHFYAVLDAQPDHRDASAEVRILEARLRRLGIPLN